MGRGVREGQRRHVHRSRDGDGTELGRGGMEVRRRCDGGGMRWNEVGRRWDGGGTEV